jgi:hypothetical protein
MLDLRKMTKHDKASEDGQHNPCREKPAPTNKTIGTITAQKRWAE